MLAGVAGGIADRFDIDANLVRVAFVVLACAWGVGVVLYVAMWALVPSSTSTTGAQRRDLDEATPSSWLAFLLLGGVTALGLLALTSWWGGPRWGSGIGLLWVVLLAGLLVLAVRNRTARRSFSRVLGILALACMTLVIAVSGAFLALVASTGVPLTGGVGDRVYQPTTMAQVQPYYRASFGNLTVDLRAVHFTNRVLHVTASVAVGLVTVEVPPGVVVDVSAHAGVGNVVSSPGDLQSFAGPSGASARGASQRPQLVLVAEAGVGQVRLVRAAAS
jgi:phage shock protein PspC (stress-responsive transcriptional regulator)